MAVAAIANNASLLLPPLPSSLSRDGDNDDDSNSAEIGVARHTQRLRPLYDISVLGIDEYQHEQENRAVDLMPNSGVFDTTSMQSHFNSTSGRKEWKRPIRWRGAGSAVCQHGVLWRSPGHLGGDFHEGQEVQRAELRSSREKRLDVDWGSNLPQTLQSRGHTADRNGLAWDSRIVRAFVEPAHNPYEMTWLGGIPEGRWIMDRGRPRCVASIAGLADEGNVSRSAEPTAVMEAALSKASSECLIASASPWGSETAISDLSPKSRIVCVPSDGTTGTQDGAEDSSLPQLSKLALSCRPEEPPRRVEVRTKRETRPSQARKLSKRSSSRHCQFEEPSGQGVDEECSECELDEILQGLNDEEQAEKRRTRILKASMRKGALHKKKAAVVKESASSKILHGVRRSDVWRPATLAKSWQLQNLRKTLRESQAATPNNSSNNQVVTSARRLKIPSVPSSVRSSTFSKAPRRSSIDAIMPPVIDENSQLFRSDDVKSLDGDDSDCGSSVAKEEISRSKKNLTAQGVRETQRNVRKLKDALQLSAQRGIPDEIWEECGVESSHLKKQQVIAGLKGLFKT